MKPGAYREKAVPPWYCNCGNPRGFEASVFRAQGLVPLMIGQTYRALVRSAGFEPKTGHDDVKGDKWLWVHPALARLIPSGLPISVREAACRRIGELPLSERLAKLDELLAVMYLAGPETAVETVLR